MHDSTVLLPAPEAPKIAKRSPRTSRIRTSTTNSARVLTIWASSIASITNGETPPSENVNEPRQRQRRQQKNHQQWHHGRNARVLQIDPHLHRHPARVIRSNDHCAEFAERAHPRNTHCRGETEPCERKRDA